MDSFQCEHRTGVASGHHEDLNVWHHVHVHSPDQWFMMSLTVKDFTAPENSFPLGCHVTRSLWVVEDGEWIGQRWGLCGELHHLHQHNPELKQRVDQCPAPVFPQYWITAQRRQHVTMMIRACLVCVWCGFDLSMICHVDTLLWWVWHVWRGSSASDVSVLECKCLCVWDV